MQPYRFSQLLLSNPPRRVIILLSIAVLLSVFGSVGAQSGAAVFDNVTHTIERSGEARVVVNLRVPNTGGMTRGTLADTVGRAQRDVLTALAADAPTGFDLIRQYTLIPALVGTVDAAALDALRGHPAVASVQLDVPGTGGLADSRGLINADDVAATYGVTGAGVTVAVLDSGIDTDHPDFAGSIHPIQACFTNGQCAPDDTDFGWDAEDEHGHGTHVSAIVTSDDTVETGIAPGAEIMAVRVLDANNSGWLSDWAAGMEFIALNNDQFGVDVVSMSLQSGATYSGVCDSSLQFMKDAVDAVRAVGVVVVAITGNYDSNTDIVAPGCISGVIAVGSTDKSDNISGFTNINSMLDIYAPGQSINAAKRGGGHHLASGTSMAAPHISAVIALLLEANPDLSETDLLEIMQQTGVPITDPRNTPNRTRVDALAALERATVAGEVVFHETASSVVEDAGTIHIPLDLTVTDGTSYQETVTVDVSYGGDAPAADYSGPSEVTFSATGGLLNGTYTAMLPLTLNAATSTDGTRQIEITLSSAERRVTIGMTDSHFVTISDEPLPDMLTLLTPGGTLGAGFSGAPIYTWNHQPGKESYALYIHRGEDPGDAVLSETDLSAADYCDDVVCTLDAVALSGAYWLTNGDYTAYMNVDGGTWSKVGGFTVDVPTPDLVTLGATSGTTTTTTPSLHWTLDPGAESASWFQLYVAPTADITNPVVQTWVQRSAACGDAANTVCAYTFEQPLNVNTEYSVYVQGWSPGGVSTAGIAGWAGPETFTVGAAPVSGMTVTPTINGTLLTWDHTLDYYQVWVGTLEPVTEQTFVEWALPDTFNCQPGGPCSYTIEAPSGSYDWFVQGYDLALGALTTGGYSDSGWAQGPVIVVP